MSVPLDCQERPSVIETSLPQLGVQTDCWMRARLTVERSLLPSMKICYDA
jgi:hypothetical protein